MNFEDDSLQRAFFYLGTKEILLRKKMFLQEYIVNSLLQQKVIVLESIGLHTVADGLGGHSVI